VFAESLDDRLEVLKVLVEAGHGMSAEQIASRLDLCCADVCCHLAQLVGAAMVRPEGPSDALVYAVDPAGLRDLMEFLADAGQPRC
jgi:hypothetical protein